jgi:hypothetical protein
MGGYAVEADLLGGLSRGVYMRGQSMRALNGERRGPLRIYKTRNGESTFKEAHSGAENMPVSGLIGHSTRSSTLQNSLVENQNISHTAQIL